MARSESDHHAEGVTTGELEQLRESVNEQREAIGKMVDGMRLAALQLLATCDRISQDR